MFRQQITERQASRGSYQWAQVVEPSVLYIYSCICTRYIFYIHPCVYIFLPVDLHPTQPERETGWGCCCCLCLCVCLCWSAHPDVYTQVWGIHTCTCVWPVSSTCSAWLLASDFQLDVDHCLLSMVVLTMLSPLKSLLIQVHILSFQMKLLWEETPKVNVYHVHISFLKFCVLFHFLFLLHPQGTLGKKNFLFTRSFL